MGIVDSARAWLLGKALKKAVGVVAMGAAAWLTAHSPEVAKVGLSYSVDPDMLAAGILAGLEVARGFLTARVPFLAKVL